MNCRVRRSTVQDIPALLEILNVIESSKQDKVFLSYANKRDIIRQNIRQAKHIFVITEEEDNGKIIGFMRESGRPNKAIMLEDIFVLPEYRGKGAGNELLNYLKSNFSHILMKTKSDNRTMVNLADKHNFTKMNTSPKGTVFTWELIKKEGKDLGMFTELLNEFEKLSNELDKEELDKLAMNALYNLENYFSKEARVLTAADRKSLPASVFGDPANRKFPMPDKEHVIKAWQFVNKSKTGDKEAIKKRILARAKALGMDTSNWKTAADFLEDIAKVGR